MKRIPILAALLLGMHLPRTAHAQTMPSGQPGGQVGGDEETKPEGAAEKAPPEAGELPSTPYLPPWPGEKKKAFEIFEIDGYFRLRTDWLDTLDLGFDDLGGGTPYPSPLACRESANPDVGCERDIGTANLRLRLEPTIHVSEKVAVHAQIDILDNLVLGSTPVTGSEDVSTGILTDGQGASGNSVVVKRAWADVTLPLGMIKFGRMPSHWGLGLMFNGGGADPYHPEAYCLDCDSGDTVDRVYFSATIPGTGLDGAIGHDWASSEPTVSSLAPIGLPQDLDADDSDDVRQWVFVISDQPTPTEWKETLEAGELAIAWGAYLVYRNHDWEVVDDGTTNSPQARLFKRSAYSYIPDGYFRLGYGKLNLEIEVAGTIGGVTVDADGMATTEPQEQELLSFGGVARLDYLMSDDDLNLGLEVGFASGDDWEAAKPGETHYTRVPALSPSEMDTSNTAFLFDPNYHVDLILFRELLGTVRNATYVKPSLSYKLTGRVTFKVAGIVSFANNTVSTPGNDRMWGVELDGDLGYVNEREGFFAGISYGVLFPLGAMNHPQGAEFGFVTGETGSAETAQTVQTRLVLKF